MPLELEIPKLSLFGYVSQLGPQGALPMFWTPSMLNCRSFNPCPFGSIQAIHLLPCASPPALQDHWALSRWGFVHPRSIVYFEPHGFVFTREVAPKKHFNRENDDMSAGLLNSSFEVSQARTRFTNTKTSAQISWQLWNQVGLMGGRSRHRQGVVGSKLQ